MKTEEATQTRRAVRHDDPNHRMTPEEVRQLPSLVILSPTPFNGHNWRFVVAGDPSFMVNRRKGLRP